MNFCKQLMIPVAVMLLGVSTLAAASGNEAVEAQQQAKLEAEYKRALEDVKAEREAAEVSIAKAREQLAVVAAQNAREVARSAEARAENQAELTAMHEELAHARRQLNETSREIARVNRQVARQRARSESTRLIVRTSDRPIIGVVLGNSTDVGIEVLGVSPDGPSERAGIEPGDLIIALGGRVLAAVDDSGNVKNGLRIAMQDIAAAEPLIISVERGDETLDFTVIPEVREPLAWHSVTRFPSVSVSPSTPGTPLAPGQLMRIERIVVPHIDTEALTEHIERIRADIDTHKLIIDARIASGDGNYEYEYEFDFHELSELGNIALHETNVWFGLPMTRGLQLAELDAGLGEYFKTDRGVLVLKAREDNDLQLESGDVILQVGDTEVNSPAEFMRALREVESGQELTIDIKRDRKNKSLKSMMPENRNSFFAPFGDAKHHIRITGSLD